MFVQNSFRLLNVLTEEQRIIFISTNVKESSQTLAYGGYPIPNGGRGLILQFSVASSLSSKVTNVITQRGMFCSSSSA